VAELFYARLFRLDPRLENLFHGDMKRHGRKLMVALGFFAHGLSDLGRTLPLVEDLGRRHAGYGAQPHHYETVAAALLWTLEYCLGDDFTDETRQAWIAAYGLLSSTMIEAATRKAA
jgi:hemoglobin-like flavoprotein